MDGFTERHILTDSVEYKIQGSTQNSFNTKNLVTAVNQVIDCVDDGQTCTYIGFKQELHTAFPGCSLQLIIIVISRRGCNLIGCHHRYIMLQEVLVEPSHFSTCGAIHKDGIKDVHTHHSVMQDFQITVLTVFQILLIGSQIDSFPIKDCLMTAGNPHYVEFQSTLLHQFLLLAANLFQQTSAHCTDSADKQIKHLIFRKDETVVDHIQGFPQRIPIHHPRA